MYIGGTDSKAMHHLIVEVLDNSMDEAVAGHANEIKVTLNINNSITISDNGRGIPVDNHPKYPDKSALEVIMTMLHSGGKFSNKVYNTSGGLHGVGISVVNALSSHLEVKILRDRREYIQYYAQGNPKGPIESKPKVYKRGGTEITFIPDAEIFGNLNFDPAVVYGLVRSKAYLFKGVRIVWECAEEIIKDDKTPAKEIIHFPRGIEDFLHCTVEEDDLISKNSFAGEANFQNNAGRIEWAINWLRDGNGMQMYYCNTIHTPSGGTHEIGLRSATLKAVKRYAELSNNKRANQITVEDITKCLVCIISVFLPNPSFQGQTKDKLLNQEVVKLIDVALRDLLDHWLSGNPKIANEILERIIQESEDRIRSKKAKEVARKSPIKALRLPGKLADCINNSAVGTEIFLVEGESAGGSAKQARNRETQAILPLKGKILNVASNSIEKIKANQEIADLIVALGCGVGHSYKDIDLRYEKVIIMTDADVDGAHIASLLMTFFFLQMPQLITSGHLYLAQPPLYKIIHNQKSYYAHNDQERKKLIDRLSNNKGKIDQSRFKGLGEMTPPQLKDTTMNPTSRVLLKVMLDENNDAQSQLVEDLMGKKPELRFKFIREKSEHMAGHINELLDV
jgi:topoisomerase-4 subunit B